MNSEDFITMENDWNNPQKENISWWKELPIISMIFRYKSNNEVIKENNLSKDSELP